MLKYLIPVVLLTSCVFAFAAPYVGWEPPTERENGSEMYLYEIGGYEITTVCDGVEKLFVAPHDAVEVEIDVVGTCQVSAVVYDTDGNYSAPTPVIEAEIKSKPMPPFNLRITYQ